MTCVRSATNDPSCRVWVEPDHRHLANCSLPAAFHWSEQIQVVDILVHNLPLYLPFPEHTHQPCSELFIFSLTNQLHRLFLNVSFPMKFSLILPDNFFYCLKQRSCMYNSYCIYPFPYLSSDEINNEQINYEQTWPINLRYSRNTYFETNDHQSSELKAWFIIRNTNIEQKDLKLYAVLFKF